MACPAAGDCVAAGTYYPTPARQIEPVVVSEHDGVWGKARPAGSLTGSTGDGSVTVPDALACSSAGNCALSAQENDPALDEISARYAIIEKNGVWGTQDNQAGIRSLSCTRRSCLGLGAGQYIDGKLYFNYVYLQTGRTWKTLWMHGVPRLSPEYLTSCAPDGTCTMLGRVHGSALTSLTERGGAWGQVHVIPGTQTTATAGYNPTALTCTAAGSCAAGGFIQIPGAGNLGQWVPFAVTEHNGTWSRPQNIPGLAKLNSAIPRQGQITAISCTGPGNCTAGGDVTSGPFVVTETRVRWHKAILVPGIFTLARNDGALLDAIACWAAHRCVAGGHYYNHKPAITPIPYVTSER